jgi:ATP-dependent Clp protease ATP-binding subunit ClpB
VHGARPVRRFIAGEVETRIARALLGGDLSQGARIRVDAKDDDVVDFVTTGSRRAVP